MGRAAAECFAAEGARVAVLARGERRPHRDHGCARGASARRMRSAARPEPLTDGPAVAAAIASLDDRWGEVQRAGERGRPGRGRHRAAIIRFRHRRRRVARHLRHRPHPKIGAVRCVRAPLAAAAAGRMGPHRQRLGALDQAPVPPRHRRLHRGQGGPHERLEEPLAVVGAGGDPGEHGVAGIVRLGRHAGLRRGAAGRAQRRPRRPRRHHADHRRGLRPPRPPRVAPPTRPRSVR